MNKLLIALTAGAFALGSVTALAQVPQGDKTPAQPVDQAKLKADAAAAKAEKAKMTPEEKKAKRVARQKEETQIEKLGNIPSGPQKAEAIQKSYDATKNDPKALPSKADKQKALKEQEKAAAKAGGQ